MRSIYNSFTFRTKKNEDERILDWIDMQSNITDAIRYLIEQEIRSNGLRDLQGVIPMNRSIDNITRIESNRHVSETPIKKENIIKNKIDNEHISYNGDSKDDLNQKNDIDDIVDSWC